MTWKNYLLIGLILTIAIVLILKIMKKENQFENYLILGDSIAEGYGLSNKNERYASLIQKQYPVKQVTDLSKSGMTARELADNLSNQRYISAIRDSNFITISIGSNELLGVFTQLLQETTITNFTNNFNSLMNSLLEKLQSTKGKEALENGIFVYKQSWEQIITQIKRINPNATIIVTEFYNPFYEVPTLGEIAKTYIERLNQILNDNSKNKTEYHIARIYEDFNTIHPRLTNININTTNLYNSSFDPHPNKEGHKLISQRIIEAIANSN